MQHDTLYYFVSLTFSWFLKKGFLQRPLPALTDMNDSTKSYKNTSRSMIHCFESDSTHIPKTVQCMIDRAVDSNALSKTRIQDLSLDLPKWTCLRVDFGLELTSEREWVGASGSDREWARVSGSEGEWAQKSAGEWQTPTSSKMARNLLDPIYWLDCISSQVIKSYAAFMKLFLR